jgi:hydrogenase expression/formation protein HypC
MCLSIPYKIAKIKAKEATVMTQANEPRKIDLNLLNNVNVGDWVLVLNNLAVEKITDREAKQIINLYKYEQHK